MGYLRDAVEGDVDLLFGWANEKSVRQNSFSTPEITYDEHVTWFQDILSKDYVRQFIFMQDGQAVGQVRLTVDGEEASVAYSICVEKRGRGFGKEMLALLAQKVRQDLPQVKKLKAKVKPDNIASQKVFFDMGYEQKYCAYEKEIGNRSLNSGGGV